MQVDLVTVILAFSIMAILFVISRLYYAIKRLHVRVNLVSKILMKLKKTKDEDQHEVNKQILEEGF